MELRLGTGFQTKIELTSVRDDLLHHRLHLVHLDRIDDVVLPLVVIFLLSLVEAAGRLFNSVVQDVGETQQHRRRDIAQSQFVHHITQVNLSIVFTGRHIDVAFVVDLEIGSSPAIDVVEFPRVFYRPLLHFSNQEYKCRRLIIWSTVWIILSLVSSRLTSMA